MLPYNHLIEVVSTLAFQSFHGIHNMKICCKDFLQVTEENYVLQKVSLDNFSLVQWFPNDKALSFFETLHGKWKY
jgi:hypothetical protein